MEVMLKEILGELKNINGRLDNMDNRLDNMDKRLDSLEQGQKEIRHDLAELKVNHFDLKKDLVDNFGVFNKSMEELIENRTNVLNTRVYSTEVAIEKIRNQ
ncbi:hypothetical protein FITA111629_12380 [Filibacter tadaridae]|uniref:Chromosome partition protein Smc n=1 Tax=Filibacter tadaridae TaxID=2483811 RepID=A0A3P5WT63_9BACL|nr:hypothetical protein [Filibacter tadaridae]VDC22491.1 hypothetical protein FILTAD_00763 [Filibacter tadaridae]